MAVSTKHKSAITLVRSGFNGSEHDYPSLCSESVHKECCYHFFQISGDKFLDFLT